MHCHPFAPGTHFVHPLPTGGTIVHPVVTEKSDVAPGAPTPSRFRQALSTFHTLPILAYHKVAEIPRGARFSCNYVRPQQFVAQLRFLRRAGFESITLADYAAYRAGLRPLPARPIIITFDDGYRTNHEIALPLLEAAGFGATVFLVAGQVGGTNRWDDGEVQEPLLSPAEIRDMQRRGIDFQSHTHTHQRLTSLHPDDVHDELARSRAALEDLLERPVTAIAYPWGDFDEHVTRIARDAGYETGVIVRRRTNFDSTPLMELRRIGINHETSLARFVWDLTRLRWRGE